MKFFRDAGVVMDDLGPVGEDRVNSGTEGTAYGFE